MKIQLTRALKIRLLKALQDGFIETDNFPELETPLSDNIPVEVWLKAAMKEQEALLNTDKKQES